MPEITEEILEASEYMYDPGAEVWGRIWTKAESDAVGDDWESMHYSTNGGYAFGDWASRFYQQGEAGSRHVSRCIRISREVYELAKDNGWNPKILIVGMEV